ncbi:MAG: PleD family two-component system response regulator, partial [Syntrophobacteria bacterium]
MSTGRWESILPKPATNILLCLQVLIYEFSEFVNYAGQEELFQREEKIMAIPTRKRPTLVLVAEDDGQLREHVGIELGAEGYTVVTATNGADAVSTATKVKPDVILMGISMPVMDGIQAAKTLKNDEETKDIPVLMITFGGDKEQIMEGLAAGAIDYVSKPIFIPELKARLNAIIRYKVLNEELRYIYSQLHPDTNMDI